MRWTIKECSFVQRLDKRKRDQVLGLSCQPHIDPVLISNDWRSKSHFEGATARTKSTVSGGARKRALHATSGRIINHHSSVSPFAVPGGVVLNSTEIARDIAELTNADIPKHNELMIAKRLIQFGLLTALPVLALTTPRSAFAGLHIRPVFIGGTPPAGLLIAGGGDLQEIFQVAAEAWENVFQQGGGKWDVTIEFGWTNLASQFAQERMLEEGGGNIVRITRSRILFNNNPPLREGLIGWFADPTPRDNSEYLRYTSDRANVVGGQLNYGRVFSEATEIDGVVERLDLLTIATHEIGHALGLDDHYTGFQDQLISNVLIRITPPRPYAGLEVFIAFGPHIGSFDPFKPLMVADPTPGWRQFISAADALLIAQISSFPRPDLWSRLSSV